MPGTIREELEAAAAKLDLDSMETAPPPVEEPAAEAAPVEETKAETPAEASEGERPRGPDGKFLPKEAATKPKDAPPPPPNGKPANAVQEPAAPPPASADTLKPPQSWKPAAREKWGSLPREVQEETLRLDKEIRMGLQRAAETQKAMESAGAVEKAMAPYMGAVLSEGMTAPQAVESLLRTHTQLRSGTPQQRGQTFAALVHTYARTPEERGALIEAMAAALDGQPVQSSPQEFRDPRFDAFLAQMQQNQQVQYQQQVAHHAQAFEAFKETHEFAEDVRDVMAALVEARRAPDIETAYDMACQAVPEVRNILRQREAASSAATASAATQRVKAAASSVKSSPTGASPKSEPQSIRDYLDAAYEEVNNR